jgi:hypothetical protein
MAAHYGVRAAFIQKVGALAHRPQTQARDVFDLLHLIVSREAGRFADQVEPGDAERARSKALTIDFGIFKSQVLAYLTPEEQPAYDSPEVWDALVLKVVDVLEKAAP